MPQLTDKLDSFSVAIVMAQGYTMYNFCNSTDIFGQIAHMLDAWGVYYYIYMVSGPNFEFGRSYATFGTKMPVFSANSGSILGTKWQNWWIYKNVSRFVKIVPT